MFDIIKIQYVTNNIVFYFLIIYNLFIIKEEKNMLVLENYEEILNIAERKENVSVDLSKLNYLDYTKSIDFIKSLEIIIKKISRSKFMFIYE